MGQCNIDHSQEDVIRKLESQEKFIPSDLYNRISLFLTLQQKQSILNDCFHLLKKYDLATSDEKELRNKNLSQLIGHE